MAEAMRSVIGVLVEVLLITVILKSNCIEVFEQAMS